MLLAITSPTPSIYSETFIHMQMERLPCAMRIHGSPVATETLPGGAIEPLKSMRGILETGYWCGLRKTRWEGPQGAELKRRLKRHRIQVVLANFGQAGADLLPFCRALGIKLVVHFHGYDAHKVAVLEEYKERYRLLGHEADAIISVSNKMTSALEAAGIPAGKIHLNRYGVDPGQFTPKDGLPDEPLFFGVGRFVDKKAPYLALLAFAEVRRKFPRARLVLGGDGPLLEATSNLRTGLGLTDAVELPGALSHGEVAGWMQRATAYVQHSLTPVHPPDAGDSEGTPVAVLEAMLTGLPVVSTRHGGIDEVITDGETGLLVEERDVTGMARAMMSLCENRDLAGGMGAAARKTALAHYTADHYISGLKKILSAA